MKNKNKKGFTLVELIVVVCIFGIIMGAILNMIKPTQQIYNDTDATMETNLKGSGLANYLDDHLRYSTNILVLKDYCGVPDVSAIGTLGGDTTPYDSCIVIDNNNLRGYSLTNYSGDDTDTAQKRMGATGCLIDVSQITSGGFNFNNSKVAMGLDYYDVYKYDITAGINTIDDMYTLDFSIDAYQPDYSNGSYTYVKTKFSKEASVNLTNINIDKGDTYKMRGFIDFSTAADYTTYPQASAPSGVTTQQSVYYDTTNANNTYTYIFYNKNSTGSGTQYEVQYVYAASDPDPNYAGKSVGSPVNVKKGALLKNAPTLAPRNGYANPYWLDEDGKTVDFTAGVVINRSQVFTAVYPPVSPVPTHIVTFKNLDGTVFQKNACSEGGPATAPGTPKDFDTEKQDWVEWNTASDGSGLTPDKVIVNDDSLVFYPIVKNKHKVEFKVNGSIETTSYVSDGKCAIYPNNVPVSSDASKVFDKWVVEGTNNDITVTPVVSDTIFVAVFKEVSTTPAEGTTSDTSILSFSLGQQQYQAFGHDWQPDKQCNYVKPQFGMYYTFTNATGNNGSDFKGDVTVTIKFTRTINSSDYQINADGCSYEISGDSVICTYPCEIGKNNDNKQFHFEIKYMKNVMPESDASNFFKVVSVTMS